MINQSMARLLPRSDEPLIPPPTLTNDPAIRYTIITIIHHCHYYCHIYHQQQMKMKLLREEKV
jgi:hypothetical protein